MPLFDYRCTECNSVQEHWSSNTTDVLCDDCQGVMYKIFLVPSKPHWRELAQGKYADVGAIDRFERVHKEQAAKEYKSLREHGDYGSQYRAPI